MNYKSLSPESEKDNFYFQKFFENKYQFSFLSPTFSKVPNTSSLFENNKPVEEIFLDLESRLLDTQVIYMKTNNGVEQNKLKDKIFQNEGEVIYDWFINHNKLSGGKFNVISNGLYCLSIMLNNDKLKLAIDIKDIVENYKSLTFKEKITESNLVDRKVYEFLKEIYIQYS